jgi:hypothetical protein
MIVTHHMTRYLPNSQFRAAIKNSMASVVTFNVIAKFSSLNFEILMLYSCVVKDLGYFVIL